MSPLDKLSEVERDRLNATINYLNMSELRGVCRRFDIPWVIYVDTPEGRRRTKDIDRKLVVLNRLRRFLETGDPQEPTVFPATVTTPTPLRDRPSPTDRLFYGHYDKKHDGFLALMASLTNGKFRNGAVARLLCREYWERGEAPTFEDFAAAWLTADERGLGIDRGDHPEAAYLTDRSRGEAGPGWKERRNQFAAEALDLLRKL